MLSIKIAVTGNPNSGKTTLFNALTGKNARVGNWAGVTVEKKEGSFSHKGEFIEVTDLPGMYSLTAASEDERIALNYVLFEDVDLFVNIVDASNLERNLNLTLQFLEMRKPVLVVMNMLDIVKRQNKQIDILAISEQLKCSVVGCIAIQKENIELVKDAIINAASISLSVAPIEITYPEKVSNWVSSNKHNFKKTAYLMKVDEIWVALRILENTPLVIGKAAANKELSVQIKESLDYMWKSCPPDVEIAESRYALARNIAEKVTRQQGATKNYNERIDKVILNRFLGIPIFFGIMYIVFCLTQILGGAFIDFFDIAFGAVFVDGLSRALLALGAPHGIIITIAYGIGVGVQTVSTFVPIIFMMFLCLAVLEDSGYMARAAFVMDKFMCAIGLPGKSFVPMLVGLGCSVPAVMASRTLESTKDRILTVFMTPFMSCSARLPVYALFGAAFFGSSSGLMVFSIYLIGGALAIFTGLLMKNTLFKGQPSYFIMELPPYHMPRPRFILQSAWIRLKMFILRAGKVVVISIALLGILNNITTGEKEESVLNIASSAVTPVFSPMGIHKDNWQATVALITGLFAKESIIGTLNSLYSIDDNTKTDEKFCLHSELLSALKTIPTNLSEIFQRLFDPLELGIITGDEGDVEVLGADESIFKGLREHFTDGIPQVYAYLLFVLLYVPCMAAMGAVTREIGGKFAALLALYLSLIAWIVSTLVYQIFYAHNAFWIAVALLLLVALVFFLRSLRKFART